MPYTAKSNAGQIFNPEGQPGEEHLLKRFTTNWCERCTENRFCEKRYHGTDRSRIWRYDEKGEPACLDFQGESLDVARGEISGELF